MYVQYRILSPKYFLLLGPMNRLFYMANVIKVTDLKIGYAGLTQGAQSNHHSPFK